MRQLCCAIFLLMGFPSSWTNERLKLTHSWTSLDFDFPDQHARQAAINKGSFIPNAGVPIDVDVYTSTFGGERVRKVFVTIPRIEDGIPATLGWVSDPEDNPRIKPYPDWGYHTDWHNCTSITSVFRVQVDECSRLWVLDTGKVKEEQVCPPRLHVFDLVTDSLIYQYSFPENVYKQDSLFVTVAVDVRGSCESKNDFAYIADVTGFGLVVHDCKNLLSWRIDNNLFYPYPPNGTFNIAGSTFDLMDGILGLALGPLRNNDRVLYFHSLASIVEARVNTSVIRNRDLFYNNPTAAPRSFVAYEGTRSSQSAAEVMDSDGILYFGLLSNLAIGCWNSKNYPYNSQNHQILVEDRETLQFPSGMKIVNSKGNNFSINLEVKKEELWILTSSFQKYMTDSFNFNETNFRIQFAVVEELTRNTKCAWSSSYYGFS